MLRAIFSAWILLAAQAIAQAPAFVAATIKPSQAEM
jgi:hypothetical protein